MLKVVKFLCFTLETGGLVIGWLTLISSVCVAILSIIGLIFTSIMDCDEVATSFGTPGDTEGCSTLRGVFIGVFVILLLFCVGCAVIGHLCIKGTKTRNHLRVKPMMILLAICAVLPIFNIFFLTARGIASGIVSSALTLIVSSLFTLYTPY